MVAKARLEIKFFQLITEYFFSLPRHYSPL